MNEIFTREKTDLSRVRKSRRRSVMKFLEGVEGIAFGLIICGKPFMVRRNVYRIDIVDGVIEVHNARKLTRAVADHIEAKEASDEEV